MQHVLRIYARLHDGIRRKYDWIATLNAKQWYSNVLRASTVHDQQYMTEKTKQALLDINGNLYKRKKIFRCGDRKSVV